MWFTLDIVLESVHYLNNLNNILPILYIKNEVANILGSSSVDDTVVKLE